MKSTITILVDSYAKLLTASITSQQLKQAVDEAQEIEKRKLNLIVTGLPEGEEDLDNFVNQVRDGAESLDPNIASCERLGKPGGRPRLMRN